MSSRSKSLRRTGGRLAALLLGSAALFALAPGSAQSDENTPPVVSYSIDGIAGTNGWYRGSTRGAYVTLGWNVKSDGDTSTSGCQSSIRIRHPNTGTTRTCTATNAAGTTEVTTKTIKVDAAPPTLLSPSPWRAADANGWYNHPIQVGWSGSDTTSGIAACTLLTYAGPDSARAAANGTCADMAGNAAKARAITFKYDGTAPASVVGVPSRGPDANGWYNHPVGVSWRGTDAASGLASCTSLTYSGPDNGNAVVSGRCVDVAGNAAPAFGFALRYDQTAPAWKSLKIQARDRRVIVTWKAPGSVAVQITRTPGLRNEATSVVYAGKAQRVVDRRVRNGVKYRYAVKAVDIAGNAASRTASAIPQALLFAPAKGARLHVKKSLFFAWLPAVGARYYNFQLWRDGRKVASFWPTRSHLLLRSPWTSAGGAHRLGPGRYTWYLWPGLGPRRLGRYGPLLGSSSFVVVR